MHGWLTLPNLWVQLLVGVVVGGLSTLLVDEKSTSGFRTVVLIGASFVFASIFALSALVATSGVDNMSNGIGFLLFAVPASPFAFAIVAAAHWLTEILRAQLNIYLDS